MARRDDNLQARLDRDLAELKLPEIAASYREVLDEAARKGTAMLEVLATLIGQMIGHYSADQGAGFITATIGALVVLFIWNRLVASGVLKDFNR